MKIHALTLIAISSVLTLSSVATAENNAIHRPHTTLKAEQVSVTYSIEVIRNGKALKVPNNYAFHNGDDVQFHVQSNTDGHIYILSTGAESGEYDVLYPPDTSDTSLKAGQDYHLPSKGVKISSANANLKLVFSQKKLQTDSSLRDYSPLQKLQIPSIYDPMKRGDLSNNHPLNFNGEPAVTVTLGNLDKALGVEINLNVNEMANSSSKKEASDQASNLDSKIKTESGKDGSKKPTEKLNK